MTREKVIEFLIEDASKHNPEEVMHYIAGYRNDNGKDYYTWGEFLDSLKTQYGSVWEDCTKGTIDLLVNHPEFFKED